MANRALTIVGTRPQLLKSVMVSRALMGAGVEETLVHTNQHYSQELSQVFLDEFSIEPHYNLNIPPSTPNQHLAAILRDLEPIIQTEKPDMVLVYGDCSTTVAAALCASKLRVPVAHVEAGPRQFDMTIPEEVNRKLTDHLSTLLFCPTHQCVNNLIDEGLTHFHVTGDVMLDLFKRFWPNGGENHGANILVTIHRPLNTDDPKRLWLILSALKEMARDHNVLFPVHPRTRQSIDRYGFNDLNGLHFSEPLGYLPTLAFLKDAKLVITDSGGLQREAYFARVPCLVLDKPSPWPEIVATDWQRLATPETLAKQLEPWKPGNDHDPFLFGDGHAAEKIAKLLKGWK